MKEIYITGIGGFNNLGESPEGIFDKLLRNEVRPEPSPIKMPGVLSLKEKSGIDKYSLFVLAACKKILESINLEALDAYEIGTLFSTEYGSCHVNLKFLMDLYTDGVQFVSPKLFTASVNNACLGPLCMRYGLKGASSMFINTNPMMYATRLLNSGKVSALLTGAVDEYDEDYFLDFKNHDILKDGYNEGVATILLETPESLEKTQSKPLAKIVGCANAIDGSIPTRHGSITVTGKLMKHCMEMALEKSGITGTDLAGVFMTANSENDLYVMEKEAIESIDPSIHRIPLNTLSHTNCLVESILDICIGTLCLQSGLVPDIAGESNIRMKETSKKHVMINGVTVDGGFASVIIEKAG